MCCRPAVWLSGSCPLPIPLLLLLQWLQAPPLHPVLCLPAIPLASSNKPAAHVPSSSIAAPAVEALCEASTSCAGVLSCSCSTPQQLAPLGDGLQPLLQWRQRTAWPAAVADGPCFDVHQRPLALLLLQLRSSAADGLLPAAAAALTTSTTSCSWLFLPLGCLRRHLRLTLTHSI